MSVRIVNQARLRRSGLGADTFFLLTPNARPDGPWSALADRPSVWSPQFGAGSLPRAAPRSRLTSKGLVYEFATTNGNTSTQWLSPASPYAGLHLPFRNRQRWTVGIIFETGSSIVQSGNDPRLIAKDVGTATGDHTFMIGYTDGGVARCRIGFGGSRASTTLATAFQVVVASHRHVMTVSYNGATCLIQALNSNGNYLSGSESKTGDVTINTDAIAVGRVGAGSSGGYFPGRIEAVIGFDAILNTRESIEPLLLEWERILLERDSRIVFGLPAAGGALTGTVNETSPVRTDTLAGAVAVAGSVSETSSARQDAAIGTVAIASAVTENSPARSDSATGQPLVSGSAADSSTGREDELAGLVTVAGTVSESSAARIDAVAGTVAISGSATEISTSRQDDATGAVAIAGTGIETSSARLDDAAGTVAVAGNIGETSPARTDEGIGATAVSGALSENSPARADASSGAALVSGSSDESSAAREDSIVAAVLVAGTANETSPARADAAAGVVGNDLFAEVDEASPARQDALSCTVAISGAVDEGSPERTDQVSGAVAITGAIEETSPVRTDTAIGEVVLPVGAANELSPARADVALGTVAIIGSADESSPSRTDALSGAVAVVGELVELSPVRTDSGTGSALLPEGSIDETSPVREDVAAGVVAVAGLAAERSPRRTGVAIAALAIVGAISETRSASADAAQGEDTTPADPLPDRASRTVTQGRSLRVIVATRTTRSFKAEKLAA